MKLASLSRSAFLMALATTSALGDPKHLTIQKCASAGACESLQVEVVAMNGTSANAVEAKGEKLILHNSQNARVFLAKDGKYMKFAKLVGQEFAVDMELSSLVAGTQAAVDLLAMGERNSTQGAGYCSSMDLKSPCHELSLFTGNSVNNAVVSASCDGSGCDKQGCLLISNVYGPGKKVITSKPFTVVTQFIGNDQLSAIRRLYRQDGQEIEGGTIASCNANGGLSSMGNQLKDGMVLSIAGFADNATQWFDHQNGSPTALLKQAEATVSNIRFGPLGTTTKA